jgi:ribosomal protein L29
MADITKQEISELQKDLADKREALRVFRFEGAGSRTRNVRGGRTLRREIARILTELRSRDLSAEKAGLPAGQAGIASTGKSA